MLSVVHVYVMGIECEHTCMCTWMFSCMYMYMHIMYIQCMHIIYKQSYTDVYICSCEFMKCALNIFDAAKEVKKVCVYVHTCMHACSSGPRKSCNIFIVGDPSILLCLNAIALKYLDNKTIHRQFEFLKQ